MYKIFIMNKKIVLLSFCLLVALSMMGKGNDGRQLFDFGWTFTHNWKTINVDLPHDWDIYEGPVSGKGATGTGGGWFQAGKGEYRKAFRVDGLELRDKLVKLHFEGVYQHAEVFVNGHKAGQHAYGYTPFTVDITPYVSAFSANEVQVNVDNSQQPNCRWYSGSGIYRHVWLETMPSLHIAENGVFVTTPEVSADKATVNVEVTVENESDEERAVTVVISGTQHKTSMNEVLPVKIPAHGSKSVKGTFTVQNPELWSTDHPHLYEAAVELKDVLKDVRIERKTAKYGIRSFSFDAEQGFVLNGKKVLINGACVHHDDGVLGAMAFDAAEIRKVRQMKEAGFNLIRTSHNPTTRAFLAACDSIGMLVIDEAFDGWRTQKNPFDYHTVIDSCYREDIHAMVKRDRNHPSVICWSIGNEVIERKDIRVIYTARQMKAAILELDTTRPVTEALCAWDRDWEIYDPHAEVLDVVGYNYMLFKHAGDHKRDPKRVIWQTESYPRDAFRNWTVANDFPYVVGDIVWTGLDYLGESGIGRNYYKGEREGESWIEGGQPEWHGAPCGDVDITGWRKPISHYREMLWGPTPDPSRKGGESLYMAVKEPNGYHGEIHTTMWSVWPTWESWTWPGWEGKPIEVEVYTRQPEVKLFLNDRLIGTKQVNRETEYKAVFTVNYEAGTLRAEVSTPVLTEGQGSGSAILQTAGKPARLRLTADRRVISADGQDLAFVTVEVLDAKGNLCPEAAIPCEISISGRAQFLAAASADLKDTEPYTSTHVTTWKGRALIVVRSTQKAGKTTVSVKSSLPKSSITITQK